ncbi:MAG: hypothetical protein QW589_04410 [Candidatus Bathyarchaeia archaeon]
MGKIEKGISCSVLGCNQPAVRSLSNEKASETGLNLSTGASKRAYLCKKHYKEVKKKTKKQRLIEKWRFMK